MVNIEQKVKAIVIPTGGKVQEDLQRAKRAINYNERMGLNAPYVVSGIGPDINIALGHLPYEERELDFHPELYDFMIENTNGIFGLDSLSVNSVQNILNTFGEDVEGVYMLVSYPLHLKRFKRIINRAKENGKISQDVEIIGIPTKQSVKHIFHEIKRIVTGKTNRDLEKI